MLRTHARLIGLMLSGLFLALIQPAVADALYMSSARAVVATTTLTWAVAPLPQGALNGAGAHTIVWSVTSGTANDYFDLVNVGTADIAGYLLTATNVPNGTGGQVAPIVTFETCDNGTWNAVTSLCSGLPRTIGTSSTSGLTLNMPALAAGSRVSVRASTKPGGRKSTLTVIELSVSRSQVRQRTVSTS
jgi:hypothetical protein